MLAILKACVLLGRDPMPKHNVAIFTDSQAAIKALDSILISSKIVRDWREELVSLGKRFNVTLH